MPLNFSVFKKVHRNCLTDLVLAMAVQKPVKPVLSIIGSLALQMATIGQSPNSSV